MFTKSRTLLPLVLIAAASHVGFAEKLVPAGSLIQCTVSENKLSSKTVAIGDPVLCQVGRSSMFTSGTVLSGRFEDYKDPGHLVGKGWMEVVFDRLIFPSNVIVPVNSKVVAVPHYNVDIEGKILGRGHATRDSVEWLIPVLWPIDLINLPRRGPRPTLKNESRITIKVMDDLMVPDMAPTQHNQYGFASRLQHMVSSAPAQEQHGDFVIIWTGGIVAHVSSYSYAGNGLLHVVRAQDGMPYFIHMAQVDITATVEANRQNGTNFTLPGYSVGAYDSMLDGRHDGVSQSAVNGKMPDPSSIDNSVSLADQRGRSN